ncbi:MAG: HAMP domain-containing histidine kinase [Desulfobacter sp.]|nr:MAG: HAMP domain-containing histidine kinase [Desulfobacter sp.]
MKPLPKLKRYISIFMWVVLIVVITAYTVLVYYSQLAGIIETAAYDMRLTARAFSAAYAKDRTSPLPRETRVRGYMGETDLPVWLTENCDPKAMGHDEVQIIQLEPGDKGTDVFILFIVLSHDLLDGKRLYLVKVYEEADDIPDAFRYSEWTEVLVLGLGIGFIVLIFLLIRLLFKKVAGSVLLLSDWAVNLNPEDLEQPRPRFKFREIDELGGLIETAVRDLHQALIREHRFLRHASHELRTPIAVLRTNMDLLDKLNPKPSPMEKTVYQRMGRALDNMHTLTETLLWLSRKEENMPDPEDLDMGELVAELVNEYRPFLAGKEVELTLESQRALAVLPRAACRMALGNLIRNAFQYTDRGNINIQVRERAVVIFNNHGTGQENGQSSDYGFGLGLSLVAQICRKLDLEYENRAVAGGRRASVSWAASTAGS